MGGLDSLALGSAPVCSNSSTIAPQPIVHGQHQRVVRAVPCAVSLCPPQQLANNAGHVLQGRGGLSLIVRFHTSW
jgi:hypothetical protein